MTGGAPDILDTDLERVEVFASEVACDPLDALGCWMSESGLYTTAWNHNGGASGIFQAMPGTLAGLGFAPELGVDHEARAAKFRTLAFSEQLRWATRYYRPYKGKLVNRTAFYVATFLPADIDFASAGNENTVLAAKGGRRGWAFDANAGFDVNHDLTITLGELDSAIQRACHGPRWDDVEARMRRALGLQPIPVRPFPAPLDVTTTRGVQEALRCLGYDPGDVDGIPGPRTRGALVEFQRAHGCDPDGKPGPLTRAALTKAVADMQVPKTLPAPPSSPTS